MTTPGYQDTVAASDLATVDFLDFGASKGSTIEFAKDRFGARSGLGVDIDEAKVRTLQEQGQPCIHADVTNLQLPPKSVRFVLMNHFLEHLPGLAAAKKAIVCAATAARDFLYIAGPYFDADVYLESLGLKFYWSDWHGHPCHLTTSLLHALLVGSGLNRYVILGRAPVRDSRSPYIHPMDSPSNQGEYDPAVHPAKRLVEFDAPLYKEIICVVPLRDLPDWHEIVHARKDCHFIKGTAPYEVAP